MESICGPAELLSSEFRLQQKRLSREIQIIINKLDSITVLLSESESSGDETTTASLLQDLKLIEGKLGYLIDKEKEISSRAEEYNRLSRKRLNYLQSSKPTEDDIVNYIKEGENHSSIKDHQSMKRIRTRNFLNNKILINSCDYLLRKGDIMI
jgi:hypothetical protein